MLPLSRVFETRFIRGQLRDFVGSTLPFSAPNNVDLIENQGNDEEVHVKITGRTANELDSWVLRQLLHCFDMQQKPPSETVPRHSRTMVSYTQSTTESQSEQEMLPASQRPSLVPPEIRILRPSQLSLSSNPLEAPPNVTLAPTNIALYPLADDRATISAGDSASSKHPAEGRRQTSRRGLIGPGGIVGTCP